MCGWTNYIIDHPGPNYWQVNIVPEASGVQVWGETHELPQDPQFVLSESVEQADVPEASVQQLALVLVHDVSLPQGALAVHENSREIGS